MDTRPETPSSRSQDGWSFLDNAAAGSIPSSSLIRNPSGRDSSIPQPNDHQSHIYNGSASRSSLYSHSRNIPSASTGARSTTTIPSQPVTTRVNSLYDHNHRRARPVPRPIKKLNNIPAPEELSIQGILSAIYEDIEVDLNTISEVLGRSRFMLADQYESQMPPLGEIVMQTTALEGIEENGAHVDDVLILNEDASLQEGSNSGSATYRMMERLQTVPHPVRTSSEAAVMQRVPDRDVQMMRTHSSPAVVPQAVPEPVQSQLVFERTFPSLGSRVRQGPSSPIVSETLFSAGANNGPFSDLTSDTHDVWPRTSPNNDSNDYIDHPIVPSPVPNPSAVIPDRGTDEWSMPLLSNFASWLSIRPNSIDGSAEARLRYILNR